MLHSSKGNPLFITLTINKCLWLYKSGSRFTTGAFSCNLLDINWVDKFLDELKKIDVKYKSLEITLDNSLCRFGILPCQQEWPDRKVLEYLAISHFQQKYPNFLSKNYQFLFDKVRFNQPTFTVAVPDYIHEGLIVLSTSQAIRNFSPALFKIINILNLKDFWYEEDQFFYHVNCAIKEKETIDVFPKKFINHDSIDLWNPQSVAKIIFARKERGYKHWSSLMMNSPEQFFNLI
ncbi:hypothetical protein MMO39_12605 [Acinetobacter modestus]|uniref:hypothetical protein n=1 Tax=Acinetobacter modestus TaxID=1776740 RepID=UPI001F4BB231|nr:hypothetical protein [Acinetobacter modestus]MCH7388133.1 hypothetical protein [Acinetobacter modestus]